MAEYRLFPSFTPTLNYASSDIGATEYYTKATEFTVTQRAWVTGIWYHRFNSTSTATPPAAIYTVNAGGATGTLVSGTSVTIAAGTATGWIFTPFASPVALTVGTAYRVAIYYSNTRFGYATDYWTTGPGASGITSGPLFAPSDAGATGARQCSYNYTATNVGLAFPGSDNNGDWTGADVAVTDIDPATAVRLFNGVTPASTFQAAANYYTLGTEFTATSDCWLSHIWYYRPTTATTATATAAVWTVSSDGTTGTLVPNTSITFRTTTATGWRSQALDANVRLSGGSTYRVGIYYSNTIFGYTDAFWTSGAGASGVTSGPITAPNHANARGTRQGPVHFVNTNVGLTFPEADGNQFYGADVSVTPIDPTGQSQTLLLPFQQ